MTQALTYKKYEMFLWLFLITPRNSEPGNFTHKLVARSLSKN